MLRSPCAFLCAGNLAFEMTCQLFLHGDLLSMLSMDSQSCPVKSLQELVCVCVCVHKRMRAHTHTHKHVSIALETIS